MAKLRDDVAEHVSLSGVVEARIGALDERLEVVTGGLRVLSAAAAEAAETEALEEWRASQGSLYERASRLQGSFASAMKEEEIPPRRAWSAADRHRRPPMRTMSDRAHVGVAPHAETPTPTRTRHRDQLTTRLGVPRASPPVCGETPQAKQSRRRHSRPRQKPLPSPKRAADLAWRSRTMRPWRR